MVDKQPEPKYIIDEYQAKNYEDLINFYESKTGEELEVVKDSIRSHPCLAPEQLLCPYEKYCARSTYSTCMYCDKRYIPSELMLEAARLSGREKVLDELLTLFDKLYWWFDCEFQKSADYEEGACDALKLGMEKLESLRGVK